MRSPFLLMGGLVVSLAVALWSQSPFFEEGPAAANEPQPVAVLDATLAAAREAAISESIAQGNAAAEAAEPERLPPSDPIVVSDARPGDLRFDDAADVLPVNYEASAPTAQLLDLAYGPEPEHRLDLLLPEGNSAPVIMYFHSGGWIGGNKDNVPDMVRRFVERGFAVVSVDYRLAPEHPYPAPIDDAQLAIRWLKSYGAETGVIDPDRIVLFGTSAGGHIAALSASMAGPLAESQGPGTIDTTVAGIVSAVGPTDLVQLYDQPHDWARGLTTAHVGCYPCEPEQLTAPSLSPYLHDDLPPAYWIYGADDPLIDADAQGRAAATAWAAATGGPSSWIDVVEGGDHSLDESQINIRTLDVFIDWVTDNEG